MDSSRSALIIASDDYVHPGLKLLRAPASDARALAAVLREPAIGGFQVRMLLNEPAHAVNLAVEEFFADRRPDDLLLVHFSCHGVKDEAGELYFAMANTMLRRLGATAVAADFVNRQMSRSRSRRVVLLLDCCYAGAFEHGMTARAGAGMGIESQFGGRGRAVITASSEMEYAFEGDELTDTRALAPSVFTGALVEGLRTGDADRDQDGLVALDELYDYVYDKVRAVTPRQSPGKWTFGVQGELFVARRARPVDTPAPLPPELQGAIDSPFAAVRAAAVQELARLLHGRHAGRALAARLALERLSEDDSRSVAAAAAAVPIPDPAPAGEHEPTAIADSGPAAGLVQAPAGPEPPIAAGPEPPLATGPEPPLPPGRSRHLPPSRSRHLPPGRSRHLPPGRSRHLPPGRSRHLPPGRSRLPPPSRSRHLPPGRSRLPPPSHHPPPGRRRRRQRRSHPWRQGRPQRPRSRVGPPRGPPGQQRGPPGGGPGWASRRRAWSWPPRPTCWSAAAQAAGPATARPRPAPCWPCRLVPRRPRRPPG